MTLEVYGIKDCGEFAEGPMTFSDIQLWDVDMKPIEVTAEEWLLTSPDKPCKGKIEQVNSVGEKGTSMTITHSTGPDDSP